MITIRCRIVVFVIGTSIGTNAGIMLLDHSILFWMNLMNSQHRGNGSFNSIYGFVEKLRGSTKRCGIFNWNFVVIPYRKQVDFYMLIWSLTYTKQYVLEGRDSSFESDYRLLSNLQSESVFISWLRMDLYYKKSDQYKMVWNYVVKYVLGKNLQKSTLFIYWNNWVTNK